MQLVLHVPTEPMTHISRPYAAMLRELISNMEAVTSDARELERE
jgi:hypothetical protein